MTAAFSRALADRHQRRTQHAVAEHVAGLDHLRDVARRHVGFGTSYIA